MIKKISRNEKRKERHARNRKKIMGTSSIPRLCVFRSNKFISVQLIDDEKQHTLASASSLEKKLNIKNGNTIETAKVIGQEIAKRAKELKIKNVVFDRGGYLYHGRVKALADAARESGLEF